MPIFSPRMQIELQARIRKEVSSQNGDVISNFKWKCIEKYGVNGLKELNSLFKQIDTSGDGTIQQDEFKRAIDRMGLRYSKNDLMILFNAFDVDGSGSISIEEFMNYLLSGLISDSRKKTVKDLFKKLDSDSSGALEVNELKNKIDFTKNGHYNSGKWSEDDCVQEFFSAFGQSNKSITYSEFLAFYAAISSCISDDAHFKLAMQKFWKSTYVESGSERRRVWPQSNSGCISLKSTQPRFVNNRFARTSSDLNTTKMSPILSSKEAVRSKSAGGGKRRTCYRSLPTYCDNSLFGDSRACRLMESDWPDFKSPFSEENKHSVHNDRPPSINNFRKSDGCKESLATHKVDIDNEFVSCEWLSNALMNLTPSHYEDIVTERSLINLCGLPTCCNQPNFDHRGQYKISHNKVYDVTHRRKFCSDSCYSISHQILKSVDSSPLWTRDLKKDVIQEAVHLKSRDTPGEEVEFNSIVKELHQLSVQDELETTSKTNKVQSSLPKCNLSETPVKEPSETLSYGDVCNILMSWRTPLTLEFLSSSESHLPSRCFAPPIEVNPLSDRQEPIGKLPEFSQLQKDAEDYNMKVKEFFNGKAFTNEESNESQENHSAKSNVFTPLLDSRDAFERRRLVVNRQIINMLSNTVIPMLNSAALRHSDRIQNLDLRTHFGGISSLIKTFNFSSSLKVFRPNEVNLFALVFTLLIAPKSDALTNTLQLAEVRFSFENVMKSWGYDFKELQRFVDYFISTPFLQPL